MVKFRELIAIAEDGLSYELGDGKNRYRVTSDGRVVSLTNWHNLGERELVVRLNEDGYPCVRLQLNGRRHRVSVHVLMRPLLPPPASGQDQIRHLNGDKQDNRIENLRWGTAAENAADRVRLGETARGLRNGAYTKPNRRRRGELNGHAVLTALAVLEMRDRRRRGERVTALAREFGVQKSAASKAIRGDSWAHLEEAS